MSVVAHKPNHTIKRVTNFVLAPELVGTAAYFRSSMILTAIGWVAIRKGRIGDVEMGAKVKRRL